MKLLGIPLNVASSAMNNSEQLFEQFTFKDRPPTPIANVGPNDVFESFPFSPVFNTFQPAGNGPY